MLILRMLNMKGPYDFTSKGINDNVMKKRLGNYVLGHEKNGSFTVKYVGRSDTDINRRLHEELNVYGRLTSFEFSYAKTVKEAYLKECKNYHEFGGHKGKLINDHHPDLPDDCDDDELECPYCS